MQLDEVHENEGKVGLSEGDDAVEVVEEVESIDEAKGEGDWPESLTIIRERENQREAQKHLLNEAPEISVVDGIDVDPSLHENDFLSSLVLLVVRLDLLCLVGEIFVVFVESVLDSLEDVEFERAVVVERISLVESGVQRGIEPLSHQIILIHVQVLFHEIYNLNAEK